MMNRIRASSSPSVLPSSSSAGQIDNRPEEHTFEGIATNVKLLLKLIQDQNEAKDDARKQQRVAGMMTIIDDVKTRIQKSQNVGRRAELRRCNTDLRPNVPLKDKRPHEPITDEKEKLRRSLSASLAARKSLEIMCTSLGKEKVIIATELARKVHEMHDMEEHINDLRVQNEKLLAKVKACAADHKETKCGGGGGGEESSAATHGGIVALQKRNKELSDQLLKSLDGCRSLKRKIRDAQKENDAMHQALEEIGMDVQNGAERIRSLKEGIAAGNAEIEEGFSALEHLFESCYMKISEHEQKKVNKAEVNAT